MRNLLIIISMILPFQVWGQVLKTDNQQIIEESVKAGLVIMSHSYQLEDTVNHQRFGRYGKPEFGKGYSIGVKIANRIIVQNTVVTPWESDSNFERYKNSHMPVLYKGTVREYSDTIVHEMHIQNDCIENLFKKELFAISDSSINAKHGFPIDTISGLKNGWLIWLVSDESIEKSDSIHNESLMIYKSELSFGVDTCEVGIKAPSTKKNVWGGIYVTPKQTSVGQITFYLSGIIRYKGNDIWSVVAPFIRASITPVKESLNDLTPVETTDQSVAKPTDDTKKKKEKKKRNK